MRGMRRPLLILLAPALLLTAAAPAPAPPLLLELRVFNGAEEVTAYTRMTVHRAGERDEPLAAASGSDGPIELRVPEGIYDVQAIEERDGRVVNIQWAHRLVVMPYPDEGGRHLEVLNFTSGYGALQVRAAGPVLPEVALQPAGGRTAAGRPAKGAGYLLFVVPAGVYHVTVTHGERTVRHEGIEVPRDRTRLWVVPETTGTDGQTRRPDSSRRTITTRAITSRTWINPPTTSNAKPSSHNATRITTMVHSMGILLTCAGIRPVELQDAAIQVPGSE